MGNGVSLFCTIYSLPAICRISIYVIYDICDFLIYFQFFQYSNLYQRQWKIKMLCCVVYIYIYIYIYIWKRWKSQIRNKEVPARYPWCYATVLPCQFMNCSQSKLTPQVKSAGKSAQYYCSHFYFPQFQWVQTYQLTCVKTVRRRRQRRHYHVFNTLNTAGT